MNNNMNKMANLVLSQIHILFPFHLILTSGLILIANNNQRVVLSWRMLSKVVFRCAFFRVFAKNMGDPYYEPTIVVHDTTSVCVCFLI